MNATDALKSPATRRLVHEVLALTQSRDIVDAIHDLEHATAVLRERMGSGREMGPCPDRPCSPDCTWGTK